MTAVIGGLYLFCGVGVAVWLSIDTYHPGATWMLFPMIIILWPFLIAAIFIGWIVIDVAPSAWERWR